MFWFPFGNRYTHPGEGLCQISHFIPEVNDFTQILALAPLLQSLPLDYTLLLNIRDQQQKKMFNQAKMSLSHSNKI